MGGDPRQRKVEYTVFHATFIFHSGNSGIAICILYLYLRFKNITNLMRLPSPYTFLIVSIGNSLVAGPVAEETSGRGLNVQSAEGWGNLLVGAETEGKLTARQELLLSDPDIVLLITRSTNENAVVYRYVFCWRIYT